MARVESESDAKQCTSQHVVPMMTVICDATYADEAVPNKENGLQEGNEKQRLEFWYSTLKIPDKEQRRVERN